MHGLRTPNEGINQKKSEILGRCGRQNMLRPYLNIWDWDLIFGRAVKAISSPGIRSPWAEGLNSGYRNGVCSYLRAQCYVYPKNTIISFDYVDFLAQKSI